MYLHMLQVRDDGRTGAEGQCGCAGSSGRHLPGLLENDSCTSIHDAELVRPSSTSRAGYGPGERDLKWSALVTCAVCSENRCLWCPMPCTLDCFV